MDSRKEVACDAPSTSGIYVIKVNTVSPDNIWVYDTGCGSYIWIDMQGLRKSRKVTKREFDLRVGNGARVAAFAIWTYVLNLPSDICLNLDDCFYGLALTRTLVEGHFLCWWYIKQWNLHIRYVQSNFKC